MNSLQILMERVWVDKKQDRDLYYKIRQDVPDLRRFAAEYPGWRLTVNERLIRLEKVPAHAEAFMGIQDFSDVKDYMMFCILLLFLEEREEGEAFLLSELTDRIEVQLKPWLKVDWTSFTLRRCLIRMMQYAEKTGLVILHEGNIDAVSAGTGAEVLYENTGLSRYFAVSYPYDTSMCHTFKDFEALSYDNVDMDKGFMRTNRVYRQLMLCPAMYWKDGDDPDAMYLKQQRKRVGKYLNEALGSRLDVHRNAAFLVNEEDMTSYGEEFPDTGTLSDIVLLVCSLVRKENMVLQADGTALVSQEEFDRTVSLAKKKFSAAWSKAYREMDSESLSEEVLSEMEGWMMAEKEQDGIRLYQAVWKFNGAYPENFHPEEQPEKPKKKKKEKQASLFEEAE